MDHPAPSAPPPPGGARGRAVGTCAGSSVLLQVWPGRVQGHFSGFRNSGHGTEHTGSSAGILLVGSAPTLEKLEGLPREGAWVFSQHLAFVFTNASVFPSNPPYLWALGRGCPALKVGEGGSDVLVSLPYSEDSPGTLVSATLGSLLSAPTGPTQASPLRACETSPWATGSWHRKLPAGSRGWRPSQAHSCSGQAAGGQS